MARLLSRIGRWRVGARGYVFAVVYFPATQLAAAAIYRRITGRWPRFDEFRWPLVLGALFVSTWTQAGEELGWRAFALPRLAERFGLGTASIVVGVVWALWHLPLFYMPGSGSEGQSFLMYLLHVTALSVAMAWLYWKTDGSLLLVMLMHAAVNNVRLVPAVVNEATPAFAFGGSLIGWLIVGVSWAVAAPMLIRMRGPASALESRPARAAKQSC